MTHKHILDELRQPVKDLREHIPGVFEGYGALNTAAIADGVLDAKTKELIALAIAVTKQCDGMNGGPGTVHAPRAFEAFQEFTKK